MSWHYLQEPEAESSVVICSDGVPWRPLRLKNIPEQFYCNGRLTESYLDSLSGTMCAPSTDDPGAERSMSSRVDSLARTFPPLEKALEYQANEAASGLSSQGLLAKYDHETHLLKTAQCSLFGDSTESLQTLPRWGTMRNGVCWERTMSVRHIKETESGYLPTPRSGKTTNENLDSWQKRHDAGKVATPPLGLAVKMFPTPTCADGAQGAVLNDDTDIYFLNSGMPRKRSKQGIDGSVGLSRFVAIMDKPDMWPTPTASAMPCEGTQRIMRKKWQSGELTLEEASAIAGRDVRKKQGKVEAMWPTPRSGNPGSRPNGKGDKILAEEVKKSLWPTPTCRDYKGDRRPETLEAAGRNATNGLPEAITAADGIHCGGQLNPDWVELLMGWPLGWTDITKPCHNPIPAWPADWEGDTPRVTQKTPHRVERLKAIGNGQVPAVAACAFVILLDRFCQPPGASAR